MSVKDPLTIVMVGSEHYGVILAYDEEHDECKVRLVGIEVYRDRNEYFADGTGLFPASDLAEMSYCENDYTPGLILAAAANYSHSYGRRTVRVV